jgi:hypothetical protein
MWQAANTNHGSRKYCVRVCWQQFFLVVNKQRRYRQAAVARHARYTQKNLVA